MTFHLRRFPWRLVLIALINPVSLFYILSNTLYPTYTIGTSMEPGVPDGAVEWVDHFSLRFDDPSRGDVVTVDIPGTGETIGKRVIGIPGDTVHIEHGVVSIDGRPLPEPYVAEPWGEGELYRPEDWSPEYTRLLFHPDELWWSPPQGAGEAVSDSVFSMAWEIGQDIRLIGAWMSDDPSLGALDGGSASVTVVLGPDEYWVMGDNRNESMDSRMFGPVRRDWISGRTAGIVLPLSQASVRGLAVAAVLVAVALGLSASFGVATFRLARRRGRAGWAALDGFFCWGAGYVFAHRIRPKQPEGMVYRKGDRELGLLPFEAVER